jgi:hypothetical protein
MTAFFNPWVLLTLVLGLLGAFGGGYYTGEKSGRAVVQQAWDKEKADQYADFARRQEEARKREQELQANADQLRREKDAEIRNVNARATALANSLRDRTERPTEAGGLSKTPRSGSAACSGKELYREDGEFLAGIAAEADRLKAALDQCTKQYNAARQK